MGLAVLYITMDKYESLSKTMKEIPNSDLEKHHIPPSDASIDAIMEFGLTFNGYKYWTGDISCGEIANKALVQWEEYKTLPDSLAELRSCLFFEQRRWRHFGYPPDEESEAYMRALVEKIRMKIIVV